MNHFPPDYDNFSVDDFVIDPLFKEWVLYCDPNHNEFWTDWKNENPTKAPLIEEARKVVLDIEKSKFELKPKELYKVWGAIQADIKPKALLLSPLAATTPKATPPIHST